MKIISVVGARPNFMKISPFVKAIDSHNRAIAGGVDQKSSQITHKIVHTGQHYDDRMSQAFFNQLGIPQADINLDIGSGTHAEQVGLTMIAFEKVLKVEKPDWVVVVGDVNAILACSVTAKKENIKCCHIEAGLRSGDMTMPEEINRLVADRICDLLLTPDPISTKNLLGEGTSEARIRFVGNIMIDTLESSFEKASNQKMGDIIKANTLKDSSTLNFNIPLPERYAVLTLHRPSNVDSRPILESLIDFLVREVCEKLTLIWPLHPRTKKMLELFGLFEKVKGAKNLILLEPLGYLELLRLNMSAKVILTDSGGLQEECTVLGTPCITLRRNTERPITLKGAGGVSVLAGNDIEVISKEFQIALKQERQPMRPELWDGKAAGRCLKAILEFKDVDTVF